MNSFVPFEHNFEPISPPDEPEYWSDNYVPSKDDKSKFKDMYDTFLCELACELGFDDSDWERDDYDVLFDMLRW